MRISNLLLRGALGLIVAVVVLVFIPVALRGVPIIGSSIGMPDQVLEAGCTVGASFGTSMLCYTFMWNAYATGAFIGIIGPVIGTYLVHREMALIGETLAHTAFAGVAFGTLFISGSGWSIGLVFAALCAGIVGAVGVQVLADRTGSYGDVPVAIMLVGSFAVGTVLIDIGGGFAFVDINSYLFGSSLSTVREENVLVMAILGIIVVSATAILYKPLLLITFDEEAARVARFNVTWYNIVLIVLTALVVVGAMQILGIILVAAMLVVPVAAASQLMGSFRETLYASIVIGEAAIFSGLVLSWTYSLRAGGTIVIVAVLIYLIAVLVSDRAIVAPSAH